MKYFGTFFLRITSANGAYPVNNAKVFIEGISQDSKNVKKRVVSDRDGVTPLLTYETPSPSRSLSPDTVKDSYTELNITVSADGYYQKSILNVSVFANVTTELPVNMIPLSRYDVKNNIPEDYNVDIS